MCAANASKTARRPTLHPKMSVADSKTYYWMKADLVGFARRLGLPTHGYKPELSKRILQCLTGAPAVAGAKKRAPSPARDSDNPLRRDSPVVNYKSDSRTREFFKAQIGPDFHFTYHVNQHRLANAGLTYGDLIDEWLAERDRRDTEGYKPTIAKHGEYNQFVRDYFADRANAGRTMHDAAAAWNAIKPTRDRRYKKRRGKRINEARTGEISLGVDRWGRRSDHFRRVARPIAVVQRWIVEILDDV